MVEIFVNKATVVLPSPKKIDVPVTLKSEESVTVLIEDVTNIDDGNNIDIKAVVADVTPPRPVKTGIIQEVKLVDNTGSIMLALWDTSTNMLKASESYDFCKLNVRSFRNVKTLSFTKQSSFNLLENNNLQVNNYE